MMLSGETWLDMLSGADTPVMLRGPTLPVEAAGRRLEEVALTGAGKGAPGSRGVRYDGACD